MGKKILQVIWYLINDAVGHDVDYPESVLAARSDHQAAN